MNFPRSLFFVLFLLVVPMAPGQDAVPLISPKDPGAGWAFGNGQEFPGATGGLTVDAEAPRGDRPSLKLLGDFSKGGQYVQAGRKIDRIDIHELSMWVRSPDTDRFTLRLNDATGQTHQISIKTERQPEWQHITFPLERFFAHRGEADAVTSVAKYESWGGAKDGAWHGPAMAIYILIGSPEKKISTLWLNELSILPKPSEVPGAEIASVVRLDEILEGQHDWGFTRGEEFPGAKGALTVVKDEPAPGQFCLKLAGDFTGGGAYVAGIKNLRDTEMKDVTAIRLRVKSGNASSIGIQLVDGSGQTHQRKGAPIIADGQWHDLVIKPPEVAGGEHWGGANDGKWHGPLAQIALSLGSGSDPATKQPVLYLADIRAEVLLPVFVQPAAFKSDFEAPQLPAGWKVSAGVSVDGTTAFKGSHSLKLSRSVEAAEQPCMATSPEFGVVPGQWEINLACKAELNSPDSSYNGVVELECYDSGGKTLDRLNVADLFGQRAWAPLNKRIEVPKGAVAARFWIRLNKTWGSFWIDEISAAFLAPPQRKDDRISRLLFSSAQLGNLLFPEDSRRFEISVETRKPLRESQHLISCVVRDYWGAEQAKPMEATLGGAEKKGDHLVYQASLDLTGIPLEIGRYYELHVAIPQEGEEPFRNFTSFAILPKAATKQFKPEEVPFTSRNWDNRISEYIKLTDRLGVRICGIWGGWSSKPPYKAEAPSLDLCEKLGMGWLTGTPIATIEQGKTEYDETALREGVRNLIAQYGKVRPMIINLGNEPHGTGNRVLANVAAYRVVYEEIKKVDPSITVVATSVEPNEEYFKAGYGKWCDAYDFHIYETADDVRRTIGEYRELMKKYGVEKPIWSTELGLNSQGLTRHAVAVEVIKKFSTFFASGGVSVSWFGLLYPDPDAKDHGSSGDSHNIFDCRYNRYSPRLDAIAYYNAVNAISVKKFEAEKVYPGGIRDILFRDKNLHSLQVLWKEKGRQDVSIPLPGVEKAEVIRIDGSRHALDAGGKALTLSITEDPILLLYDGGAGTLPEALGAPLASLEEAPEKADRNGHMTLTVALDGIDFAHVYPVTPPLWSVAKPFPADGKNGKAGVELQFAPQPGSAVREADVVLRLTDSKDKRIGELYYHAPFSE